MGKQNHTKGQGVEKETNVAQKNSDNPGKNSQAEFDYNRLKTTFISNISHEIRTPLNAILGFSELSMLNGTDLKEMLEYMKIIHNSSKELLQKIKDIIYISSLDSGMVAYEPDVISMNGMMQELHDYYQYLYPDKSEGNVEVKVNLNYTDHVFFESDAAKIVDILKRLMDNGIKFTGEGLVELSYEPSDKKHICFLVKDTGIGIPAEKQKVIFEPFATAQDTYNRNYSGSGLGLTIVQHLVRLLGGNLEIRSEVGKGTEIRVCIPFKPMENPMKKS